MLNSINASTEKINSEYGYPSLTAVAKDCGVFKKYSADVLREHQIMRWNDSVQKLYEALQKSFGGTYTVDDRYVLEPALRNWTFYLWMKDCNVIVKVKPYCGEDGLLEDFSIISNDFMFNDLD